MKEKLPGYEILRRTSQIPQLLAFDIPKEAIEAFNAGMGKWISGDVHGFWCEPESGDGHCDPEQFVVTIGQRYHQLSSFYNGKVTQSPIEDRMLGALLWAERDWGGFPCESFYDSPDELEMDNPKDRIRFILTPQAKIAGYKVDFLLWFACGRYKGGVAVECDGHAFHEKTKEQAAHDKKRDRAILTSGFPVMRFTGSEIFKDSIGCVEQIQEALGDPLDRATEILRGSV